MAQLSIVLRTRVVVAALVVPPLLSAVSFRRLGTWLGHGQPRIRGPAAQFEDVQVASLTDRILRRLRGPWRHTCLKRAAVVFYVLRCAGRPVELHIGVKRAADGTLAAHAWLVREHTVYLEPVPSVPGEHTLIARFPELQPADW